jgi:hypothetical protein
MNMPLKKSLLLAGSVIVLAVVVIYFSSLSTGEDAQKNPQRIDTDQVKFINDNRGALKVEKNFSDGVHTYKGSLNVPTPCHDVLTEVTVAESFPEQVSIYLEVVDAGGICAQVITEKEFTVEFQASEQAIVTGYLHDEMILLTE